MNTKHNKVLLTITYFATIGVMVALVVFFALQLATTNLGLYAIIGYYIILAVLVGVVIYDIVCLATNSGKYICGYILIVVSICTVAMGFIVFALSAINGIIATNLLSTFYLTILLSWVINGLAIAIYIMSLYYDELLKKDRA